jgi:hypothetical protein
MAFVNASGQNLSPAIPSVMTAAVLAFFALLPEVRAAAYTFSGTNGTFDYTSGTGWSPGAPVGGFTNSLIFGNGASLAAGANVTVSNNLGFVRFNSITVNYAGPGSGTAPTFTLIGQGVTLSSSNGSNPYILISNTGTVRPNTTISQWITFDANTTITTVSDLTMMGRFYTNANNAAGRHGGTADIQWDFRSDGTARYQAICDCEKPTGNANGSVANRLIAYSGGTWKLDGGEVVFTGEVKTVTDDSLGKDLKNDMVARFRLEPNGDLIGVSGDVSWLPEENWYPMRYVKQR